jgi:hypothetical protein
MTGYLRRKPREVKYFVGEPVSDTLSACFRKCEYAKEGDRGTRVATQMLASMLPLRRAFGYVSAMLSLQPRAVLARTENHVSSRCRKVSDKSSREP